MTASHYCNPTAPFESSRIGRYDLDGPINWPLLAAIAINILLWASILKTAI